jgi:hypothetical protein
MSGFSAGAGFVNRMQMINSETVKGVGILNGCPIAPRDDKEFMNGLIGLELTDEDIEVIANKLTDWLTTKAAYGEIDNFSNFKQNAAYIHVGSKDKTTPPECGETMRLMYQQVGMLPDHIGYEENDIGHARPDGMNGYVM